MPRNALVLEYLTPGVPAMNRRTEDRTPSAPITTSTSRSTPFAKVIRTLEGDSARRTRR